MPASRPQQQPNDKQAKTTTTKNQHQQSQEAIVSSPFNSPAISHVDRFVSSPPPAPASSSAARPRVPPPLISRGSNSSSSSSNRSHATDISYSNNNVNKDSGENVPSVAAGTAASHQIRLLNSSSTSSSSLASSFVGKNVGLSSPTLHHNQQEEQNSQQQQQEQQNNQQRQSSSQMTALAEARLFAQQLHQQQQQHQLQQLQQQQLGNNSLTQSGLQINYSNHNNNHNNYNYAGSNNGDSRRSSMTGARSTAGSVMSGRLSTLGGGVGGGTSPVLGGGVIHFSGGDEPTEQTLLLARPYWVPDQDAAACRICAKGFNAVRRKHHCRQCGHVLCYDCCSRSIALPQLGYTKAVRVCNDCFEVAYLVAYCLSDDLGPSTQIHGARGIYELIAANDEKALDSVLDHGGLDAMIYLCSMVHGYELHSLATSALAALAEHQPIQSVIVSKRAMPKLFYLVAAYAQHIVTSPPRPPSPPMLLTRMASTASLHTKSVRRIETVAVVLMNITHIVFQMVPDKLLAKQMVMEGAMDGLMLLCVYFPAGVRSRAMENAIRSLAAGARPDDTDVGGIDVVEDHQSGSSGRIQDEDEQQRQEETTLVSMDDRFHTRLESMQGLAARCISVMASDVSNQAFIVDDPERIDRLVQLLYSNNGDVVKYASKTMAYLSLRNDRFKPDIVKGSGATALLTVIRSATLVGGAVGVDGITDDGNTLSEAVSHACCALANLATNTESQEILMSQMDLLYTSCAVVGLFPHQHEIERHVARLIANLALYDQNKLSLLTEYNSHSDNNSGSFEHPSSPQTHPHRYSSPPPPPRRAKGNVIPTLLRIGALTLERSRHEDDQESDSSAYQQGQYGIQDAIDFMNDDGHSAKSAQQHKGDPGYLTPNDSVSEADLSSGHHDHEGDTSSASAAAADSNAEDILKWVTIAGTEDVQRHIIRAIDNLMTSVMDDPASNQSFKVFSRIKPTIGLIKTIQLVNQDEDTQRRATHVLSTLIEQQQIHAETITALSGKGQKQPQVEDETRLAAEARMEGIVDQQQLVDQERMERERADQEYAENERLEKERLEQERVEQQRLAEERAEQERATAAAAAEAAEKERLELEKILEKERAEQERLEKERLEKERHEQERLEQERLEQERLEQQCLEKERVEKEYASTAAAAAAEKERIEQERAEKMRAKQERLEKERLENERLEQERLEQLQLEKERAEQEKAEKRRLRKERREAEAERERVENERLEAERKDRLEKRRLKAKRLEKERLETELLEKERLDAERIEQERLEEERLEADRLEKKRLEAERFEAERIEEEERLEAERVEQECLEQERIKAEEERLEAECVEQERLEQERIKAEEEEEMKRLEKKRAEKERIVRERVEQARQEKKRLEQERIEQEQAAQIKAETVVETEADIEEPTTPLSKSSSTFEDLTNATSQDEGPKASEKSKKKKKRSFK
ncbi:hypothetical protein KI688_001110 [Linnemannia hyalina]|uniref:FYVE-type domain-containing protein n=1 Tax=Linnemannia hyalina TaxID=64524 RepID=A0A9P7Y713_9FUNG|nr:hypothetical protein KI688_001110 [Linnemannia hyalina]